MTMQGWRIEVRAELEHQRWADGWWFTVERVTEERVRLGMYELVVSAQCVCTPTKNGLTQTVWACADPLFETIYVSRPVTDAEADTLRELLDAEMRQEREARGIHYRDGSAPLVMWTAPLKSFAISAGVERIEAGQAVTLAPDGTVRPVVTWTAPTVRATEADRAQVKAALEQLSSEWCAPIRCEPPAPRVPQVGDEIEVRRDAGGPWVVARIWHVEHDEYFLADWHDGHPFHDPLTFACTHANEGKLWRWPAETHS